MKNQDFSHSKFALTPKFVGFRQNGGFMCMYFEPPKKTYYRFPSAKSVVDLDTRLYYPEKPSFIEENTRYEDSFTNHVLERENHYDL